MTHPAWAGARMEWVPPARELADQVNTLFVVRMGPGRYKTMMPAYSAQLLMFAKGRASIHYPAGGVGHSCDIVFNAPLLRAAPTILEGPLACIGASFTPLGWAILAGLPVDKVHDQTLRAPDILDTAQRQSLFQSLAQFREGAIEARAVCAAIEAMLLDRAAGSHTTPRSDHHALLGQIENWLASSLNPSVADLYGAVKLSPRHVQRLCKRYYGVAPAQLAKRYRAIRAAMLLSNRDLPADLREDVLSSYFDQAHLIHDVRRFAGRTPSLLGNDPILRTLFDPDGHGRQGQWVSQ